MARNIQNLTIQDEATSTYRDNGKTFLITEMPADQGEKWANRLIMLVANAGLDLPAGVLGGGMAGLASIGVAPVILEAITKLNFESVEPLLDEMMACVQYRHAPAVPLQAIMPGANCQIEEVQTFWKLRLAWLELHLGFTWADVVQKLRIAAASAESSSQNTPTSPDSSAPS